MLEHRGRTSGLRRYVVLEIVDRPALDTYVVVSGLGGRAQWFRNVEANPQVRVHVGSRKPAPAIAHRLDADATAASLGRYASAHPRSWAKLRPVLEETLGTHRRARNRTVHDRHRPRCSRLTGARSAR